MTQPSTSKIKAVILGTFVAIGIGEAVVRLFPTWHDTFLQDIVHSQLPTDLYKPVGGFQPGERPDKARFKHHPNRQAQFKGREFDNWVYTDANGFRVSPEGRNSSDVSKRILLLGDSFLFAGQVPWQKSFVGRLEERIPNVEWLNAGVDGYNTSDALLLWKESRIESAEVWLFFFWGNDIWENDWSSRPSMKPDESAEISFEGRDGLLALLQYSKFASRLYALWAIQTDDRFAEKQAQLEQLRDVDQLQLALVASEKSLDEFALECVRQKVDCRIWLVPPMEAFTESGLSSQVVSEIQEIIPAIIPAEDMMPALQNGGIELYFRSDPHWNSQGHQVVADWLVEQYTQTQ